MVEEETIEMSREELLALRGFLKTVNKKLSEKLLAIVEEYDEDYEGLPMNCGTCGETAGYVCKQGLWLCGGCAMDHAVSAGCWLFKIELVEKLSSVVSETINYKNE